MACELCVLLPTLVPDAYTCLPRIKSNPPAFWYGAWGTRSLKVVEEGRFYEKVFGSICLGFKFKLFGVRARHRTTKQG